MTAIVDTNVILVANRQHGNISESCVAACAGKLQRLMDEGRIAIDDGYRILSEYQHKATPQDGKGAGDVFLKWLLRNIGNPARCDQIKLVEHSERGFESFPDDDRLADFDLSDRKFVAVAAAHPQRPPILQASDAKWLDWSAALHDHRIAVELLCPADIRSFQDKRFPGGVR